MGRIKTKKIKSITLDLFSKHGASLSNDFAKNKELVAKLTSTSSKKLRNVIAGYCTRLVKNQKEL